MPGETHQVGYDGDTAVHRSRAARGEFGDRAPWSEIDPRLTDLVMPGIDGVATAAQIVELHPTARFLFSSGYAEHEVFSSMDPNARFLPKPYTVDQLARAVRDALAAPAPGG